MDYIYVQLKCYLIPRKVPEFVREYTLIDNMMNNELSKQVLEKYRLGFGYNSKYIKLSSTSYRVPLIQLLKNEKNVAEQWLDLKDVVH